MQYDIPRVPRPLRRRLCERRCDGTTADTTPWILSALRPFQPRTRGVAARHLGAQRESDQFRLRSRVDHVHTVVLCVVGPWVAQLPNPACSVVLQPAIAARSSDPGHPSAAHQGPPTQCSRESVGSPLLIIPSITAQGAHGYIQPLAVMVWH